MQCFLTALIECSVAMSVLILLFIAITPILSKRYAAKWRYYVWLVIVIGLIVPFRPHFDTTFIQVDAPASPLMIITQSLPVDVADINTAGDGSNVPWSQLAGCLWLVGVITVIAYHGLKHYRFIRIVNRWGEDVTDQQVLDTLHKLKDDIGISKQVKLQICSCVTSPLMIGFINSVILLPETDFSVDELSYILKHELVHFKRKDLWYKSLVLIANAIHWFNPVVYLMARAIAVQCEISCDAEVVQGADMDERQQYSETIIGVIKNQSRMQTALSTNFYGGKKGIKTRIFSIMDTTKKKVGITILCVALLATVGTGIVFAASSPKEAAAANKQILNETAATETDGAGSPAKELNIRAIYNMGNYSEFLKVKNDTVKYYYNGHWVFSLYDENNEDAKLINENAKSIIYENAMEDKDVKGKGTPVYLKTVRNKETNKIENLVEMSADEAWKIINSSDDNTIRMARTPRDDQ